MADVYSIRTYSNDYAGSDDESENQTQLKSDSDKVKQQSIPQLQRNQNYIEVNTSPRPPLWTTEKQTWKTSSDKYVELIRNPTASHITHHALNPDIYRNLKALYTLSRLAEMLRCPADWQERCNAIVSNSTILGMLYRFRELPHDTSKRNIGASYMSLVTTISIVLGVTLSFNVGTKIIVGGFLAHHQYDVQSITDLHCFGTDGHHLLASEAQTYRSFEPGEMWYHHSRGAQVLSALYSFNCPTLLYTQYQWKLFVESDARDSILTFPFDEDPERSDYWNSASVEPLGRSFLVAISICILRGQPTSKESKIAIPVEIRSQSLNTINKTEPRFFASPETPKAPPSQRLDSNSSKDIKIIPKFVSGYEDGMPVYTDIRVSTPEMVARVEEEDALLEREKTLIEQEMN